MAETTVFQLPDRGVLEEFMNSQDPNESGCWLWNGPRYKKTWHGQFRFRFQGTRLAHRLSWMFHNGPIPAGMVVCHRCDVPHCVNPEHLFLGTWADNVRDMYAKGRQHIQAKKTHCRSGHEFSSDNTFKRQNGTQGCKRCRSDRQLEYKGRNLEAVRKYQRERARELRGARHGR